MFIRVLLSFLLIYPVAIQADIVDYKFDITTIPTNITGEPVEALAIANQIPAPTIRANIGDTLRVTFNNYLDVTTSVHWHGVLLPASEDGVPYLNTQPVSPGGSHTFEFPILHAGTYWYHSHTDLQIQKGIYGALVFSDLSKESVYQDEVVIFSDWTDEEAETVLDNLKKAIDFYALKKDTVYSWDGVLANGYPAIKNRLNSSFRRMGPADLADVGYDAFLVNGSEQAKIVIEDENSEYVKLRMINGSTSSIFDVEYAGGPMRIISADGREIKPIRVKRLRISTAETYDVLVPVHTGKSMELRATSFDGTGFSSLYIGEGKRVDAPAIPSPNLYIMEPGSMGMDMSTNSTDALDQSPPMMLDHEEVIAHIMGYEALSSVSNTSLPHDQEWRDIELTLTGDMERYVWSFNGKTASEDPQVWIRRGENVRFHLTNETMMHHPLHLHGHFFRVVNQYGEKAH